MELTVVTGAEVHGSVALLVGTELIVLAGQDSIHNDAHQCSNGQTGQGDGGTAQREGRCVRTGGNQQFAAGGGNEGSRHQREVDDAVVGGNKVKIGIPITLEGAKYKLKLGVINNDT